MADDRQKSPAFQFYPKDFLSDEKQLSMSLAEAGAYIRLISACWLEGSLPNEPKLLARLCGATSRQIGEMWPAIGRCFRLTEDGRWIHPRLEIERMKQATFRQRQSDKGKASAEMKAVLAAQKCEAQPGNSSELMFVPSAIEAPPVNGANAEIANESNSHVQPRLKSGCPPVEPRLVPKLNSPISYLQSPDSSQEKDLPPNIDERWEQFKAAYPSKGREQGFMALQYFLQGCRDVGVDVVMAGVERYAKSKNVKAGFVTGMQKWLERGLWIQEPEVEPSQADSTAKMAAELAKIDAARAARGR